MICSSVRLYNYRQLVAKLLAFVEFHGSTPSLGQDSTAYERGLYYSWYRLERRQAYRNYYNCSDRQRLLEAGYVVKNARRYQELIADLLTFAATYNRSPAVMHAKPQDPTRLFEYRLGRRLYNLYTGADYQSHFCISDMEKLIKAGISIE